MDGQLDISLELLKKYFRETPKDIIEKDLSIFDEMDLKGPTYDEYLELFTSQTFNQFEVDNYKQNSLKNYIEVPIENSENISEPIIWDQKPIYVKCEQGCSFVNKAETYKFAA